VDRSRSLTRAGEDDVMVLSLVDIFDGLSPEEISAIEWRHLTTTVKKGEVFFTPMDLAETLFVLREGSVRIYRKHPDGRELTLAVIQSGTVFGEMALTGQRLQNSYAEGLEESQVAAMCRADVERLILEKPRVGLQFVHLLSDRLAAYETRMEALGLKEVPARLASVIHRLIEEQGVRTSEGYRLPVRYTHDQLATMIGSTRASVTRAIATLRGSGVIETKRRYIHVEELEALELATHDSFYEREEESERRE
jgi:CRP/FNR family transcriptional regulator, cyclic AMP receptor protein